MTHEKFTNHLIGEKSPYLLQHVHNPVDWRPWGDEAFELSHKEDKPIFLSIGYATCHWCHVMERETFVDEELGALMNELFVNIKVDREELPDVDSLYMDFAQSMLGGAAGWPLNLVLTPDLRPFYAATYLPPSSRYGLIGMRELVTRIRQIWHGEERQLVQEQAQQVFDALVGSTRYIGGDLPDELDVINTAELLFKVADPVYGGIQGAPKFPIGYQHLFLLRHYFSSKDSRALFCAEKALQMMHNGGIYDHLGGGFSRYSVDERWLIPHFEKMLYDNALLAESYIKVWQVTKKELYREVAEETLHYVLRDMTDEKGGFYSAEDADSEGKEGRFYTWTPQEVAEVLGDQRAFLFCDLYGISPEGNFEEERSILHLPRVLDEAAKLAGEDPTALQQQLNVQRTLLWKAREKRVHPFKDDKILSSWNGLMIHTLAYAGAAFRDKHYLEAAEKAANFIKEHMWVEGQLLRRWRQGEARFDGGLEEYAYLIRGLLTLFEVTGSWETLDWAVELCTVLEEFFKIPNGAFYQTNGKDPNLIFRKATFADGAEPSGNAIHTENLLRLYAFSGNEGYLEQAEDILRVFKVNAENNSVGFCYYMMALQRYLDKMAPTIVVALNKEEENRDDLEELIFSRYLPNRTVIWCKGGNPFFAEQKAIEGKTTLYLCRQGVCQQPLTELDKMREALDDL